MSGHIKVLSVPGRWKSCSWLTVEKGCFKRSAYICDRTRHQNSSCLSVKRLFMSSSFSVTSDQQLSVSSWFTGDLLSQWCRWATLLQLGSELRRGKERKKTRASCDFQLVSYLCARIPFFPYFFLTSCFFPHSVFFCRRFSRVYFILLQFHFSRVFLWSGKFSVCIVYHPYCYILIAQLTVSRTQ